MGDLKLMKSKLDASYANIDINLSVSRREYVIFFSVLTVVITLSLGTWGLILYLLYKLLQGV